MKVLAYTTESYWLFVAGEYGGISSKAKSLLLQPATPVFISRTKNYFPKNVFNFLNVQLPTTPCSTCV